MTEFPILRDLGLVVLAAAMLLFGTRKLHVPPIVGYMLAGLALGPLTGLLAVSESVDLFSELGVALLLFVVGLELSLDKIRDLGRTALAAGLAQVVLTFGLGSALGLALGMSVILSAFVGLVATFSSTVVVVKLLDRAGDLDTLHGRLAVAILLVQDVVVAVVLTAIGGLAAGGGTGGSAWIQLGVAFAGLGAMAVAGGLAVQWVLPRLFAWLRGSTEAVFIVSLTWAMGFIIAAEMLHMSVELGAFVGGVALAQLPHNHDLRRRIHPLVDFFLAVFFVSLGANMEPAAMARHWVAALALSGLVLLVKPALVATVLGLLGQPRRASFLAGLALGQISEFGFILAASAIAAGLLPPDFLGLVGLTGLITIGVSAVLVPRGRRLFEALRRAGVLRLLPGTDARDVVARPRAGHIIVVGMNTLGRMLVRSFHEWGERVLAVDTDPAKLEGLPGETLVGSVDSTSVLEEAGLDRAKLVVSALQIEDINNLLAYRCRRLGVPVSIHAFDPSLAHDLMALGADHLMVSKHDGIRQMALAFRRLGVIGTAP